MDQSCSGDTTAQLRLQRSRCGRSAGVATLVLACVIAGCASSRPDHLATDPQRRQLSPRSTDGDGNSALAAEAQRRRSLRLLSLYTGGAEDHLPSSGDRVRTAELGPSCTPDGLAAKLRRRVRALRSCYRPRVLQDTPRRLDVVLHLDRRRVQSVELSAGASAGLSRCLERSIKRWKVPARGRHRCAFSLIVIDEQREPPRLAERSPDDI